MNLPVTALVAYGTPTLLSTLYRASQGEDLQDAVKESISTGLIVGSGICLVLWLHSQAQGDRQKTQQVAKPNPRAPKCRPWGKLTQEGMKLLSSLPLKEIFAKGSHGQIVIDEEPENPYRVTVET